MTLFLDGVAHYATANIPKKYSTMDPGSATAGADSVLWSVATGEGRLGANCLKCTTISTSNNQAGYLAISPLMTQWGPWSPNDKGIFGFAIKVEDLRKLSTSALKTKELFAIYEGGGRIFYVILNPNGTFSHYFHEEAPLATGYVGSSLQGLRSGVWSYVEFRWTVHLTEGRWVTRINDVEVFDIQDSMAAGERRVYGSSTSYDYLGVWDACQYGRIPMSSTTGSSVRYMDIYLADQEEHAPDAYTIHDFAGDMTIGAIFPEGVGTYAEFTPVGVADNWDAVNETAPNDGTDYVQGAASGLRDRHVMQNVPAGAVILAYQSLIYAKKTTTGAAILDPVLRIGGSDYVATGQGVAASDDFAYIIQPYDNDPSNGNQLTEAVANAMEAGYDKEY